VTAPQQSQRGFTLVELMVSLVIFTFAIAGVLSVAVSMTRAYREQRRVIATENAVRAPLDFIVDAVRQASPGVTTAVIADGNDCTFTGNAITFVDSETGPDELTLVFAAGGVVSTTHSALTSSSTSITIPAVHLDQFAVDDYVLVTDGAQGTLIKVTGIGTTSLTIAPTCATAFPAAGYASGSILVRAMRARFTVGTVDGIPTLLMYPNGSTTYEPLAEGIEDFQIAIGVDTDNDGALTEASPATSTDEWDGNAATDSVAAGTIRAVKIALVSRDAAPLTGTAAFYTPQDVLNHPRPTSPTADNYRRRMLQSTVEIRNLAGSP
jgi:prepilin-type N-terminal cleavage/methylation domain-containing protein